MQYKFLSTSCPLVVVIMAVYATMHMNKHIIIGISMAALVLVGAGCKKAPQEQPEKSAPAESPQSATSTAPGTDEQNGNGAGAEADGEVRIDLRKDGTSASPKASAGDQPAPSNQQQPPSSNPLNQNTAAEPAPSVPTTKSFTITASQWAFSPNTITVKQGDTVRLRVNSIDVAHGFLIQGYNINKVINPGETIQVEFVADKKGTFTFLCSVQCGAGHPDMRGKLVVE